MADASYNNYSPELLKHFPDIKMGSGKSIKFQIANVYTQKETGKFICPTSATVLPIDRITDPYTEQPLDIAYITGRRPLGPNSPRAEEIVLGDIVFSRGNMGMFEWFGDAATKELAKYLFFCNVNKSNIDKPWHIKPSEYIIQIISNEANVTSLASARKLDSAYRKIEEIAANPKALQTVKMGMFPNDYMNFSDEQIVLKLRAIAATPPDGADKILRLSGGPDMQMNVIIQKFVKAAMIKYNDVSSSWEFVDGRIIVKSGAEETPVQALKAFFSTDAGQKVYDLLAQNEEAIASDSSSKVAPAPKPTKAEKPK